MVGVCETLSQQVSLSQQVGASTFTARPVDDVIDLDIVS